MKKKSVVKATKEKTFEVSYNEVAYYLTKEIKASTKEEAIDKYLKMMEDGEVDINDTGERSFEVKEINVKK